MINANKTKRIAIRNILLKLDAYGYFMDRSAEILSSSSLTTSTFLQDAKSVLAAMIKTHATYPDNLIDQAHRIIDMNDSDIELLLTCEENHEF